MDRQRRRTVIHIRGSNRCWGQISAVGNFAQPTIKIDVVKAARNWMLGNANDAANARSEIAYADWIIVHIKSHVANPSNSKVPEKVGILVISGKAIALIPGSSNRA